MRRSRPGKSAWVSTFSNGMTVPSGRRCEPLYLIRRQSAAAGVQGACGASRRLDDGGRYGGGGINRVARGPFLRRALGCLRGLFRQPKTPLEEPLPVTSFRTTGPREPFRGTSKAGLYGDFVADTDDAV